MDAEKVSYALLLSSGTARSAADPVGTGLCAGRGNAGRAVGGPPRGFGVAAFRTGFPGATIGRFPLTSLRVTLRT
jgi:hypothetical protein